MSVVLNRPQVLNCLTIEMIRLIQEAMKKAYGHASWRKTTIPAGSLAA
jgi:enoyl-CoA hydratase/carnithine racemase